VSEKARNALLVLLAEAAVAFASLFAVLAGWRRDFRVPLAFTRDALEYLMQVKGTIDNGWWWVHPRLSAPGVFEQVQYPSNTTVDQAIVWIVHLFTRDVGLCINVSWMIMVILSALVASRCLRLLGVPRRLAIPAGLLFALSPYALFRNIDHFSLATYLVPIPCTVALLVATGRFVHLHKRTKVGLAIGSVLVGLNYPYYAFFACFLILVASFVAVAAEWNWRELRRGLVFVGAICFATAVNLAPSLYAWHRDGKPVSIPEKHAAEAEQYGLKLRQLVSPVLNHSFAPFRHWTEIEEDAEYPLETAGWNDRFPGPPLWTLRPKSWFSALGWPSIRQCRPSDARRSAPCDCGRVWQPVQPAGVPGDSRLQPGDAIHRFFLAARYRAHGRATARPR
jgi:phosphoglycerol transferase